MHRDIKPENILLADGIALVADFGIARSCDAGDADRTQAMTVEGGILGTPLYMSPEQACGEPVGPASDVYSLACVVFEMLAGQRPFEASTRVLARALAKRPEDRYGSAVKFAEALTASAAGDSTLTPPPAADALPASNLPKQRTHFIGRERELAECARLLGETRVLTLTGIGGCGKTRLALKLAEHMLPSFTDGAWFVDLAPLHDGSRVPKPSPPRSAFVKPRGSPCSTRSASRRAPDGSC